MLIGLLVACDKNDAEKVHISVHADKTQVGVGEPVTFTISHNALAVAIFTGDEGHDYRSSATYILAGKTEEELQENIYRPFDPDVIPYDVDFADTQAGSATIAGGLADVVNAGEGYTLMNMEAEIVQDASIGQNVLKVVSTNPDWWYQALRFNTHTKLATDKTLTLRMRFEKDYLEEIYSGEPQPDLSTFPVVIRLAGIGAGETEVTFSDETVWDIYWHPELEYTDYTVDLARIIEAWEVGTGKTMNILSYIQILFTSTGSVGYVGDYFVESVTYGAIDYTPFDTGVALAVSDNTGIITYEYTYHTPGTYEVVVLGTNTGFKSYSGGNYKDDRGDNITAGEYDYNTQYSTVEIVVK